MSSKGDQILKVSRKVYIIARYKGRQIDYIKNTLFPNTSHLTCLIPHISHLTYLTSRLTPHTSHHAAHISHISHFTLHTSTSHHTSHTSQTLQLSHLIPHTSHLTSHTSHLTSQPLGTVDEYKFTGLGLVFWGGCVVCVHESVYL